MKQCEKCGLEIEDSAAFCTNCGAAVSAPQGEAPNQSPMAAPASTPAPGFGSNPSFASSPMTNVASMDSINSPFEEPKKKIDGKMIAMIAVSAVCLIVGVVGIILAVVNNGGGNNDNKDQVAVNDSDDGGSTVDVVSSGAKVSYAGYEFAIPTEYEYEVTEKDGMDVLLITDSDDYLGVIQYYNDATFASIKSNKDSVAESISAELGSPVTVETTTEDGVEFVNFNLGESQGVNMLYAVSEADLYYFETVIITNVGVDGSQYLSNIAKVVKSAQKKSGSDRAFNNNGFNGVSLPKITAPTE